MRRGRPPHPELLTPREQEVLQLIREGLTNQQIADRLGISRAGAAYHVGEILSKLQVSTRQDAARLGPELARRRFLSLAGIAGFFRKPRWEQVMRVASFTAIGAAMGTVMLLAIGMGVTQLRSSESSDLSCVTGEDAINRGPDGYGVPGNAVFESINEGEEFICLDVPQLPEVDGWYVAVENATRSHSLDSFEPGEFVSGGDAYRFLAINYLNPDVEGLITFDFTAYPEAFFRQLGATPTSQECEAIRTPAWENFWTGRLLRLPVTMPL